MHHTKDKGDLGVLKAFAHIASQGYIILTPLTEHAPFDLVAYKDNRFIRVQVKYRHAVNDSVNVCFRSNWTDKYGTHTTHIDKDTIDIICIYCPDTDNCYYFDPKLYNRSFTLRFTASKNSQKSKIHLAKDFMAL